MKNILFSLVLGLFFLNPVFSQESEKIVDKKSPHMEFNETVHDYGTLEYGGDGTTIFKFKNTGKDPLVVTKVRTSCGCTSPSWSKEPVKKNKTGEITVKYNTRIPGRFTKTVTVYSNAPESPVRLKIKGEVVKQ
jgi:hypothetical protein